MANNLIHFELHRGKELKDLVDPCTVCTDKTRCTCAEADSWWIEFARLYKRQGVVNKLGGE